MADFSIKEKSFKYWKRTLGLLSFAFSYSLKAIPTAGYSETVLIS